jgi:nitroreductase/NAD-dependent dihydropyrimidine dehydrogenase PreA subunit
MTWEEIEPILCPDLENHVFMGRMKVNKDKCTKCGLCMKNCPFQAWEEDEEGFPKIKEVYECFSCFNCMVPCPVDAVEIVDTYHVSDGFWKTGDYPVPFKLPLEPKDEEGNPTEWNEIEKLVLNRRSVRNFKDKAIPESIITRVLEAGRFAPSAGNCQPWKFIVITNKEIINEMEQAVFSGIGMIYSMYTNKDMVKNLAPFVQGPPLNPGTFDPRLALGGMGAIVKGKDIMGAAFNAPVIILLLGDRRSIASPELNIGICGQNMNLVANSLGIKGLWNGFIASVTNTNRPLKEKLGIKDPWVAITSMCLGYPKFKQEGIVPREYREIVWFREDEKVKEAQPQVQAKESTVKV